MGNTRLFKALLTAASAGILFASTAAAQQKIVRPPPASRAMMILDHSLSMWANTDSKPRYIHVRDSLKSSLRPYDGKISVGLMTFGHRTKAGCSDITLHQRPRILNTERLTARLRSVKPNGRTPLTRALGAAVVALPRARQPAHIVLIADGYDNCSADACALAKRIAGKRADLKIHVIAYSASPNHVGRLACIAKSTNGVFTAVRDARTLNAALRHTLVAVTGINPEPPKPALVSWPRVPGEPQPREPQSVPQTIVLTTPKTPPPQPRFGPRRLAALRFASRIPVPRKPPRGRLSGEPPLITGSVKPTLSPEIPDAAKPAPVARASVDPKALPKTPADDHQSNYAVKPSFSISPKEGVEKAGLALRARITGDLSPIQEKVHWTIYLIEDAAARKWRKVAEKSEPAPKFDLPRGDYVVRAAFGHASAATVVPIPEGKFLQTTIIFNAGGLKVSPRLAFLETPEKTTAALQVFRIAAGGREERLADVVPGRVIRLNAGPYRLVSRIGRINATRSAKVMIKPGLLTQVEINHKAGIARFALPKPHAGSGAVHWRLSNGKGKLLHLTDGSGPQFVLAPGQYVMTARKNGKTFSASFGIGVGDNKTVTTQPAERP